MQGLTIDAQNGRIIFTTKEPFGELLFSKLSNTGSGENYNDVIKMFLVFIALYDSCLAYIYKKKDFDKIITYYQKVKTV